MIDTHAHLDDDRFSKDLPAVLERARAAGLERILTIGIDLATSRAAIDLATKNPILRSVVGIQPNHVSETADGDWEAIVELARHLTCVAIGETGLDRHWDRAPFDLQEEYFAKHLELARNLKKPVVIHCREAEADVVRMLQAEFASHGPIAGVMHSFCGDAETAKQCLAMGLHVSFAGMLTYNSAADLRTTAVTIPIDRVLVETDSPYLAPVPHRGKRNEPGLVVHTAACLAEVLGVDAKTIDERTTENAKRLFGGV